MRGRCTRAFAGLVCGALLAACVTPQQTGPVSPETIDRIEAGSRVTIVTKEGKELSLRVSETTPDWLVGRDRHFGERRVAREDIKEIDVPPQYDWPVAMAWAAIVLFAY